MNKYNILKSMYGYSEFRNPQEEVIDSILSLTDTIAIFQTGGGKSICFQIPALLLNGLTIVISPLISLMIDQNRELRQNNIKSAYLNSSLDYNEIKKIYTDLNSNKIKILYTSPEKLLNKEFLSVILKLNIAQISIDEAHCISVWGHDFRPSYQNIANFIEKLKKRPVISAFSATANNEVINDIINVLKLNKPNIYKSSFDRKNLFYKVIKVKNKDFYLLNYLKNNIEKSGIIYALTIKEVLHLSNYLSKYFEVIIYHGMLENNIKLKNQNDFINGSKKILIATNAFGMGINKSNIRFVINYSLPSSMEDLSQQSGRCSRDNEYGECIILYDYNDIKCSEYFISNSIKNIKNIKEKYNLKKTKYKNIKNVINYCLTSKCLHYSLALYFEEKLNKKCNMCSNCMKFKK